MRECFTEVLFGELGLGRYAARCCMCGIIGFGLHGVVPIGPSTKQIKG
jgi:hypothetical protein